MLYEVITQEYGLYTQSLLRHIQQPGLKVEDVFKSVRAEVLEKSNGTQTPWESSSLVGDFYFNRNAIPVPVPALTYNTEPEAARITSYNVCYTKLLRKIFD